MKLYGNCSEKINIMQSVKNPPWKVAKKTPTCLDSFFCLFLIDSTDMLKQVLGILIIFFFKIQPIEKKSWIC